MYAPSVFDISGGSWLRLRITGADRDAIVNGLEPACNELQFSALVGATLRHIYASMIDTNLLTGQVHTLGKKAHPA